MPESLDGRRLLHVLRKLLGKSHPGSTQKLLRQGRVLVDGMRPAPAQPVRAGQKIVVLPRSTPKPPLQPNRRLRLDIAHEDEHFVVVRKPAGLAVHPGTGHGTDTLLNALLARYDRPLRELGEEGGYGLVHRLDRGTSGLMVVALSRAAYDDLRAQFAERRIEKEYLCLVHGLMCAARGKLAAPIEGREAATEWTVKERLGTHTLLAVRPLTGRTHQIRIHLAGCGHPVAGDRLYLDAARWKADRARLGLERPFLHARRLAFHHPRTGELLAFEDELPADLAAILEHLRHGSTATSPGGP
ncbi:MAG: RluA family pseudouridine synthase [Planctomycetota bacterium]